MSKAGSIFFEPPVMLNPFVTSVVARARREPP
jgi:hypothetical protein